MKAAFPASFVFSGGASHTLALTLLLKGPDRGFYLVGSFKGNLGYDVGLGVQFSTTNFHVSPALHKKAMRGVFLNNELAGYGLQHGFQTPPRGPLFGTERTSLTSTTYSIGINSMFNATGKTGVGYSYIIW